LGTPISVLGGWATVSGPFSRLYPAQIDLPVATVKKNPLNQLNSTYSGKEKRGYPSPEGGKGKGAFNIDNSDKCR
jgi:hypothetical protein